MTSNEPVMPPLAGYQIIESIYSSTRTVVYRAVSDETQRSVVIKTMRQDFPSFNELAQFRNQYAIATRLPLAGIVPPHGLYPWRNGYALVMADCGGLSLQDYVKVHPLSLPEILEIGIQITEILHGLSQHRVVHKDIKPANLLIHPHTHQIHLIDFSIASVLPRETQTLRNPNVLEGTLAYLAPEQTGRMNRGIDYRADFYSFGVTLYELLTGQLPFEHHHPMDLVHAHIATAPPPLYQVNSGIPKWVSAIILKLMAKNAEDRYQSAHGIQHDLQQCLNQWQDNAAIALYKLGERDICDRFLISEKLYGRALEVQAILDAFERVAGGPTAPVSSAELLLITGHSGIGKTAVINEVHKPITRQQGYFIKGKFDQFNRKTPFSAFVQAFRALMGHLLSESEAQLAQWQTQILDAVGDNGQVLITVIPELEQIIGPQPPVPELMGSAAQNRFNLLLSQFLQVFTTSAHPLVLFLDDLQWADAASLNLLQQLMADSTGYLLVLGAYRDNEVFAAHPLMLTLAAIEQQGTPSQTLTLQALKPTDINRLVADTLLCPAAIAAPLSELVYQKTQGNPFFATQFLQVLYDDGTITFNATACHWQCNLTQVRQLALTDNVVTLMADRLQQLPEATQTALKVAACIGNQFDLATLAVVCETEQDQQAAALWPALQEGFLIPESETYRFFQALDASHDPTRAAAVTFHYRFLHDRVQQAAYALIPNRQIETMHLRIGQLLLQQTPATDLDSRRLEIVQHLNLGITALQDADQRDQVAQLNLEAGQQAQHTTAYAAALDLFQTGITLLRPDCWQSQYSLTHALYVGATETAYLSGDFEQMETYLNTVLQSVHDFINCIPVYEVKLQAYNRLGQSEALLQLGLSILEQLGIELPKNPGPDEAQQALQQTGQLLAQRTNDALLNLTEMVEPDKLATTRILMGLLPAAHLTQPLLFPLLVSQQLQLAFEHGHSAHSAYFYAAYGVAMCAGQQLEQGNQYADLALSLLDRYPSVTIKAKAFYPIYALIKHWRSAIRETLQPLRAAYVLGLETGDFFSTAHSAEVYCFHAFVCGCPLTELAPQLENYAKTLQYLHQEALGRILAVSWQTVLNFMDAEGHPSHLQGAACNEEQMLSELQQSHDHSGVFRFYCCKLILAYVFGETDAAVNAAAIARLQLDCVTARIGVPIFTFYESLALLTHYPDAQAAEQQQIWDQVQDNQAQMHHWAEHAPMNHAHRYAWVAAEQAWILGEPQTAIDHYQRAIALAKEHGFVQDEALAHERLAQVYLAGPVGQLDASDGTVPSAALAIHHMQDAYYGYARWGAKAKVTQLEQDYPQLLEAILQVRPMPLSPQATLSAPGESSQTISKGTQEVWLDFPAVLEAAQAISQEIELETLVATLMQVAIANAGAQTGHLILGQDDRWRVVAQADRDQCTPRDCPLEDDQNLATSVVYTVARTQETMVFDALHTVAEFAGDTYIVLHQPQSVLCLPIAQQSQLVGVLYLENNLTVGAFTRDRVKLLQLLTAQAAISIENARLYQQTEAYSRTLAAEVAQQTTALQQKAADLEDALAQLQHTNQELERATRLKDEFLANMSHELRTPLNAILGMTEGLQEQVFGDLNPKQSDILKIIERSGTHLLELINDILDVAKIESGQIDLELEPIAWEPLCRSSLAFIKQQALKKRIQLEIKLPSQLPSIRVDERRMRQVLINLLNNAVKFTPNGGQITLEITMQPGLSAPLEHLDTGQVHLLKVAVIDTGIGITAANQKRLFQPFIQIDSALNRQYAGTGLGLSLVKRIVELHGGQVGVTSEAGVGSCFFFELPYTRCELLTQPEQPTASEGTQATHLASSNHSPLILMAEDNPANVSTLSSYLEAKGYRMVVANDGQAAIALAQAERPDLILMDIQMPGMDGLEATQQIRQLPQLASVPIVALTALAMAGDRERCLAAGANDYLSKPVKLKQLATTIQQHLA